MSPIEISEIERRLGAGLDRRAGRATVPSSDEGRAAIDRRVTQRRHHRRVVRTTAAVLVVLAVLAVGFGVTRGRDDGQKVVSGPNIEVPPLPQLGLPAQEGTWRLTFLWPGAQEVISVMPRSGGDYQLDVVLSDLSLDEVESAKARPGDVSESVTVDGHKAFGFIDRSSSLADTGLNSGIYWKPDADHVAALDLATGRDHSGLNKAVTVANQLVTVSEAEWWEAVVSGSPSTSNEGSSPTGLTPAAGTLVNPAARLGLAGDRTLPYEHRTTQSLKSVLDVAGYTLGTFVLNTYLSIRPPPAFDPHSPDAVRVRGRTGSYQAAQGGMRGTVSWVEGGIIVQLSFARISDPMHLLPGGPGRLPSRQAVIAVADQLRSLSMSSWHSLLLPTTLRTDTITNPAPGNIPCLSPACPPGFRQPSTTTTGG